VASLVDSANRAFVQWRHDCGLSQSFFDFYSVPAMQYRGGYLPASDTGDGAGGYGLTHSSVVASPARFLRKRAVRRRSSTPTRCLVCGTQASLCGTITPVLPLRRL